MNIRKKRNLGIDILCCIGVMLLLCVQYMDAVGFTAQRIAWGSMLPVTVWCLGLSGSSVLAGCMGYVMGTKKWKLRHFKPFLRLTYIYLLCGVLSLWMRVFLFNDILNAEDVVHTFLFFTPTQTGGTVGMYFALILAAPLLNAIFQALEHRYAKLVLVLVMLILSGMQPFLMGEEPSMLARSLRFLYPAAAYLGGAYIHKYHKSRSTVSIAAVTAAVLIAEAAFMTSKSIPQGILSCPQLNDMAALPSLAVGLLLVMLVHSMRSGTSAAHNFFMGASGGALAALMLGDLVIDAALPALDERFPEISKQLAAGLLVVPVVFILCCTIGLILQLPVFSLYLARHPDVLDEPVPGSRPESRSTAPEISPHRESQSTAPEISPHRESHSTAPEISPHRESQSTAPEISPRPKPVPDAAPAPVWKNRRRSTSERKPAQRREQTPAGAAFHSTETIIQESGTHPTTASYLETLTPQEKTGSGVYVPRHEADPSAPVPMTKQLTPRELAERATARRKAMTIDQILLETKQQRSKKDEENTVDALLRKLESGEL